MSRRSSPLDAEPCKQCTSFKDYAKLARKKVAAEGETRKFSTEPEIRRTDCPLDKDDLGSSTWGLLHTIAAKYPSEPTDREQKEMNDFFQVFSKLYPCEPCAEDLRKELRRDPPETQSYKDFSQWLCRLHNKVNVKTGKPEFDCSKVDERWRDGWLDGSCD